MDVNSLKKALAKEMKASVDAVQLRVIEVAVPGLMVFTAYAKPRPGERPTHYTGTFDGKLDFNPERNMQKVLKAWNYGAQRTVSAADFAQVIGVLEGNPGNPFVTQMQIDQQGGKGIYFVPREATIDGLPAVEYTVMIPQTQPRKSTAVVKADFSVEIRPGGL